MRKILMLAAFAVLFAFSAQAGNNLTVVQHEYVCMVNNRLFSATQIPVKVNDKTYYGCCPMCKDRLAGDAVIRSAVDPVSGNTVDKADAVIGARPDGDVLYFENIENLKRYK